MVQLRDYDRATYLLALCGFLDLFSVSMLITTLPIHLKSLGVSPVWMGVFHSEYGALQIFSSSCCGWLMQQAGIRLALALTSAAAALAYGLLGQCCHNFTALCCTRALIGVVKHTQTLQRAAIIANTVANDNRVSSSSKNLGLHSAASSLGFILGPAVAGKLYELYGFCLVAMATAGLFLLISIITHCCLTTNDGEEQGIRSESKSSTRTIKQPPSLTPVADLLFAQFLLSSSVLLFRNNFALQLQHRYSVSSATVGYVTSAGAVSGFVSGLFGTQLLRSCWPLLGNSSWHCVITAISGQILCYAAAAGAGNVAQFTLAMAPLSFFNGVARDAYPSLLLSRSAGAGSDAAAGGAGVARATAASLLLGISQSVNSASRLLTPLIAGLLEQWVTDSAIIVNYCVPSVLSCCAAAVLIWMRGGTGLGGRELSMSGEMVVSK